MRAHDTFARERIDALTQALASPRLLTKTMVERAARMRPSSSIDHGPDAALPARAAGSARMQLAEFIVGCSGAHVLHVRTGTLTSRSSRGGPLASTISTDAPPRKRDLVERAHRSGETDALRIALRQLAQALEREGEMRAAFGASA
jgi:hypothetical protein